MWTVKIQRFLYSPITALFVTLILAAIAFSGKLSMNFSNFLLIIALLIGLFGIYRSGCSIILRLILCLFLFIVLITIYWWINPDSKKAAKPLTTEDIIAIATEVAKQIPIQKGESDERIEQRLVLFSDAIRNRLKHEFSFGYTLFSINFSDFAITERERGIPPNENGKPNQTAFDWMGSTHVQIDGNNVLFELPYIVMPPNLIMIGNEISLLRKTGVGLTLDIDPCHPLFGLFRGNTLSSTQPETEISLSENPTLSIVVEILSISDKGILTVLGLKPYKNTGLSR